MCEILKYFWIPWSVSVRVDGQVNGSVLFGTNLMRISSDENKQLGSKERPFLVCLYSSKAEKAVS